MKITKKFKFGLQPDVFISADDFGVAPELLTTAQKVAILESQSFQTKSFNPILPSDKPSSKRNAASDTYVPGYSPNLSIHLIPNLSTHLTYQYISQRTSQQTKKQCMYFSLNTSSTYSTHFTSPTPTYSRNNR